MSLIVANNAFHCISNPKSCVASVSASADGTLGILIFRGGNSMTSAILSDIFLSQILSNTYNVTILVR